MKAPAAGSNPNPIPDSESPAPITGAPHYVWPVLIVCAGFIARIVPASRLFLNPDEALHNLLASQSSFAQAWAAALTNAHPPLLILLLYYWRSFGTSELWLRLPSVIAGTAACWLFYEWLRLVTSRSTAFLGLILFSFSPSLILLSAEVRQYALLLFFEAGCLYLSERALQKNSPALMAAFSFSLYGALLTHYSALMFALTMGIYVLVRLYPDQQRFGLFSTWVAGQIGGVAIAGYFLLTHIPRLRATGMVRADLESYLRRSIYHPGERNPAVFVAAQTLRVFTYLFSHGLIGALLLLAFLAGIFWLLRRSENDVRPASRPTSRELALLLVLPFIVNWGASLAGLYPIGATRHSSFLAPFAIAGACLGIASIPARTSIKTVTLILALTVCNLFPAPPPPIRPKDQSLVLVKDAVASMHDSVPAGSVFLTDYESGLLLGYYLCGHGVVQIFPPQQSLASAPCDQYTVLATSFRDWKFTVDTFPKQFAGASGTAPPGREVWLFYAGWINDSAPALKSELTRFGCPAPQAFGENIFVCRLETPARDAEPPQNPQ
jgi:hypothetical protein